MLCQGVPCALQAAYAHTPESANSSNPPPNAGPIMRYSSPHAADGENYALTVLQREQEFTEEELLRYCDDVYPIIANEDLNLMLLYMTKKKGWESDRVFYIMAKIIMAENALAREESQERISNVMSATPRGCVGVSKYLRLNDI